MTRIVGLLSQSGGFWGQVSGAATVSIFTLFPRTSAATFGTSADQSIVSGFLVAGAGDSLDFSLSSFGTAAASHRGLTNVDGASTAAGGNATITTVSSGGSLSGTTADVVVIAGTTSSGAAALPQALKTGTFGLNLSAYPTVGFVANMLFAYNDAAGNGHIADVAINEVATNRSFAAQTNVIAQDLVQLTGVSVASLTSNNIQIVG